MTAPSLYVGLVASIGLITIVTILHWVQQAEKRRRLRLEHRGELEPTSLKQDPQVFEQLRGRGLLAINEQYRLSRRLLVPAVLCVIAVMIAVPFIPDLPAQFVSLVAAGFAILIGIAARPVVENVISGLVIGFTRAFNVGDTVEVNDFYGTVEDLTATHTIVRVWDGRRFILPHSELLRARLVNYSLFDGHQWAHVDFWVSPTANFDHVSSIAIGAANDSQHASRNEAPSFWIMEIAPYGVRCRVAAWADNAASAWELRHEVRKHVLSELSAAGYATHVPVGIPHEHGQHKITVAG